jgi:hypothetical protein
MKQKAIKLFCLFFYFSVWFDCMRPLALYKDLDSEEEEYATQLHMEHLAVQECPAIPVRSNRSGIDSERTEFQDRMRHNSRIESSASLGRIFFVFLLFAFLIQTLQFSQKTKFLTPPHPYSSKEFSGVWGPNRVGWIHSKPQRRCESHPEKIDMREVPTATWGMSICGPQRTAPMRLLFKVRTETSPYGVGYPRGRICPKAAL